MLNLKVQIDTITSSMYMFVLSMNIYLLFKGTSGCLTEYFVPLF